MKIAEIIAKLEAFHAPLPQREHPTVDRVLFGDPDKACTGVAVTCWASAAVIRQAAQQGCNFIIAHEPLFFDHLDNPDWLAENRVYQKKKALLEETGMVVYRDHDHVHNDDPDRIFTGVVKALGWAGYQEGHDFMAGVRFVLPAAMPAREVARHVSRTMGVHGMRMWGDPDTPVQTVGFSAHFLAGPGDKAAINQIDQSGVDMVIPGEVIDWTIGEYIMDAETLGFGKVLLNLGHFNWEEPGMEDMARWLPDVIGPGVPVQFIKSGDRFTFLEF
ncbi:Nif3-like dinuclear metal center hexameric protein [Acutalibacter caecimuris]|uniref:Nif3-like dinuclear metal center hexameric protein n=1 Tax=Acutalibacter caecimuris TaxID=3093657 RepID=UPI002AC8BA82|nr:Nif3-like dinuclear metal center hexameric protein [Acutalibacter sp. M00118]